jgi:VanZ family protein
MWINRVPVPGRLAATLVFMTAILALSVVPSQPQPGDSAFIFLVAATPTLLQKTLHVCFYGTLALLWVFTVREAWGPTARLAGPFTIAVSYGAIMEVLQLFIPGRFATLYDVMLNALGATVGILVASRLLAR